MENSDTTAALLSDPVPSPLMDAVEAPATAKPDQKAEKSATAKADPATAAEDKKTGIPGATDETANTENTDEANRPSRRQRKLQIEREARAAAEARAEAAERALSEARKVSAPVEPKLADFQSEAEWLRACQKWDAAQAEATRQEPTQRIDREQQRLSEDWAEREREFVEKVPTFGKDVAAFLKTEIDYFSQQAREKIVELGPEVLHYLATNPDVADDIIELSPRRQVAALGNIDVSKAGGPEGGDAGEDAGSDAGRDTAQRIVDREAAKPAPSKRADPPAPAKHSRQGNSAPAGMSDDMDTYVKQRKEQGARWAR